MGKNRAMTPKFVPEPGVTLQVCTVGEAAETWHKHEKTILLAIHYGHLRCRLAGSIWLIEVASLQEHWGNPPGEGGMSAD